MKKVAHWTEPCEQVPGLDSEMECWAVVDNVCRLQMKTTTVRSTGERSTVFYIQMTVDDRLKVCGEREFRAIAKALDISK